MARLLKGRYEALEVVGRGGEGEVLRALDHQHDRLVALKVRRAPSTEDREALLHEARILLSLTPHPNLPLVREDFFVGDKYYIAMDWVEGSSLQRIIDDQGDPGIAIPTALEYLREVAGALDHIHAHAPPIVHRDVKPANIIRTPAGRIVLVDFGIARIGGRDTQAIGTSGYLAPEIAMGAAPTAAADVYGLAATAWALLTGSAPAAGAVLDEGVPAAFAPLARVIRKGLSVDPARRPGSAGELVARLASHSEDEDPAVVAAPKTSQRRVALSAAAGTTIIALLATFVLTRPSATVATTPVAYQFPLAIYSGNLILQRTWTMSGTHLSATVNITNAGRKLISTTFDELVPKSLAASVDDIRFTPTPDAVIKRDPIVRYNVSLAPGRSMKISYEIDRLPNGRGDPAGRLRTWAVAQGAELKQFSLALPASKRPIVRGTAKIIRLSPSPSTYRTPHGDPKPRVHPTFEPASMSPDQKFFFDEINKLRANAHVPLLSAPADVQRAAVNWAQKMFHDQEVKKNPNIQKEVPSPAFAFAENVGSGDIQGEIFDAWASKSSDTRRIMLDPKWTHVGVGVGSDPDYYVHAAAGPVGYRYWVDVVFAQRW